MPLGSFEQEPVQDRWIRLEEKQRYTLVSRFSRCVTTLITAAELRLHTGSLMSESVSNGNWTVFSFLLVYKQYYLGIRQLGAEIRR